MTTVGLSVELPQVVKHKITKIPGRDHYQSLYREELELEAEWLRRGAVWKATSIYELMRGKTIAPKTMLELGCGTGAVIQECQRRGLAEEYVAVDYSEEALAYLRDHSNGIDVIRADITDPDFTLGRNFDVVVLSHVLEHLEDPRAFLDIAIKNIEFHYIIIEVPLEDLPYGKIKSMLTDRRHNRAGHVQFFNRTSLDRLVISRGLSIVGRKRYMPILGLDTIRFDCVRNNASRLRRFQKNLTGYYLPKLLGPFWTHLYYAHYAVLCRRGRQM